MDIKYFDIHGHINFPDYNSDRETVIKNAQTAGVGMITVGTDLKSSEEVIKLSEKYENMWAIIGLHPTHVGGQSHTENISPEDISIRDQTFNYDAFKKLAFHPKVVAIGECGLDYFHAGPTGMSDENYKQLQRDIFIQHIKLANEVNKPLMLHIRNAKVGPGVAEENKMGGYFNNAYQEAISILKQHAKVKVNFHFFAGTVEDAKAIIEMGGTVSFTGVLTFARNYDGLVKSLPIERIMSETDCPFVAPAPFRGKRNEPAYVVEVVKAIAKIRGEDLEKVTSQLVKNTKEFFSI